jgi:hypothetical protein
MILSASLPLGGVLMKLYAPRRNTIQFACPATVSVVPDRSRGIPFEISMVNSYESKLLTLSFKSISARPMPAALKFLDHLLKRRVCLLKSFTNFFRFAEKISQLCA